MCVCVKSVSESGFSICEFVGFYKCAVTISLLDATYEGVMCPKKNGNFCFAAQVFVYLLVPLEIFDIFLYLASSW